VVTTMSGVSLVVVGLSLRASSAGATHAVVAGTVPVGIVAGGPAAPAPAPSRAGRRAQASPRPSPTATRPAVHHHAVTHVATATAAATASPKPKPKRTASPKPAAAPTYTVNGPAMDTRYGPVQVQLKIRNHQIIEANAIEYPQGSQTDQDINSQAIPQLDDETLQAQSAQIDSVSGATYTSQGYISSLQSAVDQAHQAGIF